LKDFKDNQQPSYGKAGISMYHPFLIGDRIYLRGLEKADLSGDYFQWLNDYEVTKYLESGAFPNSCESMEAYYESRQKSRNEAFLAIVLKNENRHIGNIKLGSINWIHRTADVGIIIGAKDCWNKGYGTEAMALMLEYAFERLNLRKIYLGVVSEHKAAIRVYEKLGFVIEGDLKEFYIIDGKLTGKTLMGINKQQFVSVRR
jgi:[ribosomal protein S5]-alanine N-acetyltransferase